MTVDDMAATIYALSNEAKSREASKSHRAEEDVSRLRANQDEDIVIQSVNGTDAPNSPLAKRNAQSGVKSSTASEVVPPRTGDDEPEGPSDNEEDIVMQEANKAAH